MKKKNGEEKMNRKEDEQGKMNCEESGEEETEPRREWGGGKRTARRMGRRKVEICLNSPLGFSCTVSQNRGKCHRSCRLIKLKKKNRKLTILRSGEGMLVRHWPWPYRGTCRNPHEIGSVFF